MTKVLKLLCTYCNHMFKLVISFPEDLEELDCPKCGDKNIENLSKYDNDVYGYNSDKPKPDAWVKKN